MENDSQFVLFVYLQTNSDFDAKPMVMLLGQYSTGKTTFIKHLLGCDYPGNLLHFINSWLYKESSILYVHRCHLVIRSSHWSRANNG